MSDAVVQGLLHDAVDTRFVFFGKTLGDSVGGHVDTYARSLWTPPALAIRGRGPSRSRRAWKAAAAEPCCGQPERNSEPGPGCRSRALASRSAVRASVPRKARLRWP